MTKCQGETIKEKPCKNKAEKGSRFCRLHSSPTLEEVLQAQKLAKSAADFAREMYEKYQKSR